MGTLYPGLMRLEQRGFVRAKWGVTDHHRKARFYALTTAGRHQRHSTAKMTLDTYTQALSPQKRAAQSKVAGMIRSKPSCTVVVPRVSGEIPVTH
jgi:DNA-binding PadR family transcriptional regulator